MLVAGMVVGVRGKGSGERIDPGTRANQVLIAVQARDIRVGAARAKMGACLATTGVTSAANSVFQCIERMFHPRLTNLFEALLVILSSAHTIEILRHEWVIGIW